MTYWNEGVVAACILLLFILLWKEVRRTNKAWLAGRIAATCGAVAALAGAGLPLTYQKKEVLNGSKTAILITEGFSDDSVQAFTKNNGPIPVFTLDKKAVAPNRRYLTDIGFLGDPTMAYAAVQVFGNGLDAAELEALNTPFLFHPTPVSRGIIAIHWNSHIISGGQLKVQGQYKNDKASDIKIVLNAFDTGLDSVLIAGNTSASFELTGTPRHLDRAVYAITVVAGKDTLEQEPLPVMVTPATPIKVLMLISSPDFENKFIKNWLAHNAYPVVVRSRISKDKFTKDYLNTPAVAIDAISTTVLSQFDVLMADATELSNLPLPQAAAVAAAISQQGMGLIVRMDSSVHNGVFPAGTFPLVAVKKVLGKPINLRYTDDSTSRPASLLTDGLMYIREQGATQPLVTTNQSEILVSSKLQGKGKIIVTTLNNTYSWQLSGNENGYSAFWTNLLSKAAKKKTAEAAFAVNTSLPAVNEKVQVQLQTAELQAAPIIAGADEMRMEQNEQLPFLWQGTYWPVKGGWLPLTNSQKTVGWIYVFGKNDWQQVRAENKKRLTQKRAALNAGTQVVQASATKSVRTAISKLYFFLIFVLAASFLWFEKKYKAAS